MNISEYFNPKKSTQLFSLNNEFTFLKDLFQNEKFPTALLLTGEKGIGKSTLINHLMYFIFARDTYDIENNILNKKNYFYNQFCENVHPNIIYLNGNDFLSINVDDIRNLKNSLTKTPINNLKRFIILDDIDVFNVNCINALLKIIEEPGFKNNFILINNKSKPLLDTLKSRCLELKIFLNEEDKKKIISSLINLYDQKQNINSNIINVSPGNYIKYNYLLIKNNIDINGNFFINLNLLLKLYKKEKNSFYKDLLIFYSEYHLKEMKINGYYDNKKFIENRLFFIKHLNEFFLYNLNQNTLLNSLERRFSNE